MFGPATKQYLMRTHNKPSNQIISHQHSYDEAGSHSNETDNNIKYRDHYYHLESVPQSKTFSCEVCSKSFFSHGQFKKHINEHVECPFPECKLKAHVKIIDQHINHQHMLVNFEALQIDDEAWVAERKKRFPTAQRAEQRRAEQLERIKRGEKLGKDSKKFAQNKSDKSSVKGTYDNNKNHKREKSSVKGLTDGKHKHHKKDGKKFSSKGNFLTKPIDDSDDSDSETKWGVSAFRGTKEFFVSTGEMSLFGAKKSINCMDELPDIDISDEEDWKKSIFYETQSDIKTNFQNALGSLICAYDSNSESDCEKSNLPLNLNEIKTTKHHSHIEGKKNEVKLKYNVPIPWPEPVLSAKTPSSEIKDNKNTSVENLLSELKDESNSSAGYGKGRKRTRRHKSNDPHKLRGDQLNKLQVNQAKRRRPTLLQKLLEPDVTHERNLILQCIRYVVENNYLST